MRQAQPRLPGERANLRAFTHAVVTLGWLASCTGAPAIQRLEATVEGLVGSGLVLQVNGEAEVTVTANGRLPVAFVAQGSSFFLTVKVQPSNPAQTCTVTGGRGKVGATDVTDIRVSCVLNEHPVIQAGAEQHVSFEALVTLDANGARNPVDGSPPAASWIQLLGPQVAGTIADDGLSFTFVAPSEVSSLVFQVTTVDSRGASSTLTTTVHVLRRRDRALFVSNAGQDTSNGSRSAPMLTIQAALDKAAQLGEGAGVYVAEGRYEESLWLKTNVGVYGGFGPRWLRDVKSHATLVAGESTAVTAIGVESAALDGIIVTSAPAAARGGSAYGVFVANSRGVTISSCAISAGPGAKGRDGVTPPRPDQAPNGGAATPVGLGGTGGCGATCGGRGGDGSCQTNGGTNGVAGTPGITGAPGASGAVGAAFGSVSPAGYAPAEGATGEPGGPGSGGLGGTGAVATAAIVCDSQGRCISACAMGGGGGGGGGGGLGGTGGSGGAGGGGSFGIFVVGSDMVTIRDTSITTADGAPGGNGADGGPGGHGGTGGAASSHWQVTGGTGGMGGQGGKGGVGGCGAGGPTIGILVAGPALTTSNVSTALGQVGPAGGCIGTIGLPGERAELKNL